jgi:SAM-dependent methyltransferase
MAPTTYPIDGWQSAYEGTDAVQLWSEQPVPFLGDVVARLELPALCADLGCGDGRHLIALQAAGIDVIGVDISATALARANRLLRMRGRPAPLLLGDFRSLPFPSESLDAVTALDCLGQVNDPEMVLGEARRVLRPGGLFATNLFSLDDETYGEGREVAPNRFLYKETLFRYYDRAAVDALFSDGWETDVSTLRWHDPPHGDFRPYHHTHVSHVALASPK